MRRLIVSAACLGFALTHGVAASAIVIATSDHFEVSAENIGAVGAGAAGENLRAFTLTVTNVSGDLDWAPGGIEAPWAEGYDAGIIGNFHQEWPIVGLAPSPYPNGPWGVSETDTHFLVQPADIIALELPNEDIVFGTSAEPPPPDPIPTYNGFGTHLAGIFALNRPLNDVWELAHIAMPAGLIEINVHIGSMSGDERLTGSTLIGLPGDNYRPKVEAGGPYTIIDMDAPSLPDGGSVQFAGSATDFDGQIDSVQWEIARQGQSDWLALPNGADTLDPILTESELRGLFGPGLQRDQMFDLRLIATDDQGGTGLDTATLTFVPEPSTWLLLMLGTAGLWFWRRR